MRKNINAKPMSIISIFLSALVVALIFGCTCATADEDHTCGDNLTWAFDYDNDVLTISGTGNMYDYSFSNSAPWRYVGTIRSVVICDGVTSVGKSAFSDMPYLTSVTFGNGIEQIRDESFTRCTRLSNVVFPDSLTTIGRHAFSDCSALTSISIPEGVTVLGGRAFSSCSNLAQVAIQGVRIIEDGVFSYCKRLSSIVFSNQLTEIGDSAFFGCEALTSLDLPDSVTTIGSSAFGYCNGLTSLDLSDALSVIGDNAFSGCSGLTSVLIPSGVTSIGSGVFCADFDNTMRLTAIEVSADNRCYTSINGILYTKDMKTLVAFPPGQSGIVTVLSGVEEILEEGFSCCTLITEARFPSSLRRIGRSAFFNCTGLTSITLNGGLQSIGNEAFFGCLNLSVISIPADVSTVKQLRCYDSQLTEFLLPASVIELGYCTFSYTKIGRVIEPDFVVPSSVHTIEDEAFADIDASFVYLDGSVSTIGSKAFARCTNLQYVLITSWGAPEIADDAFDECSSGLTLIACPPDIYYPSMDIEQFAIDHGFQFIVNEDLYGNG